MKDGKKHRILVVDDNGAIHDDFRKILCEPNRSEDMADLEASLFNDNAKHSARGRFEIDSVFQGNEGLERVQQATATERPYALAFVDIRMPPGWDGIETTARIWEVDPDIQVVICTAYADYSWDQMIDRLGQSDRLVILKKPFDNIEVLQLAQALTHKWCLLQQVRQKMDQLEQVVLTRTSELTAANESLKVEIDERKNAEHERQQLELQLLQAQKLEAIGQLAAGIAHEINTPMQFVGDNTRFVGDNFATIVKVLQNHNDLIVANERGQMTPELLKHAREIMSPDDRNYLCEQIPTAIQETLDGVKRVTKIVRAMKEFSHPAGQEKAGANLNKAIESTVTVARHEWKYVAEMQLELDPALPAVQCFVDEFNQCILNLVINAAHAIQDVVKATPGRKGVITIQTRRDGGFVEVSVGDTGTGIPESARTHIFEPFFTTKPIGKGTGQGLAIVYASVVKKHGGVVRFETEMGKGTKFILRLPIDSAGNP